MDCISSFQSQLAAAISAGRLLEPGRPVLVALSAGADSTALLAALVALGYDCRAAHCNYHLRGDESNRDKRQAEALCAALGVDLYVRDFDVEARRRATGESVEMACRELRYGWFAELLDRLRAQAIAVAHHREDNVETLMLNLMRGSGLRGLAAMRQRNGHVVRPLLGFSRLQIEDYLRARHIAWVDDSTNAESLYARNRLRNIVLPTLEQQFPGATDGILRSIACLADNCELFDALIAEKREEYIIGNELRLADIASEPYAAALLYELLSPMGYNRSQTDSMLASPMRSGASFVAGHTAIELDRGIGRIVEADTRAASDGEIEVSLARDVLQPVGIASTERPVAEFAPERDPRVAYFDADMLAGSPRFTMRHWRRGDRIKPYGMDGSKLVSDLFAAAKYSAEDKRKAWLLLRDGQIIWIPGLRASRLHTVGPSTRRFLTLRLL